jgi:predicted phage baseplate assembly protein
MAGPTDRGFVTQAAEDGSVTITFGNGANGARLPTGQANVTARYRSGIGRHGNVRPGQLSQLMTRPYGVQAVTNPIEAAGGADRESRDQVRENAALRVMALDRLVGPQDYADFSRTFAGIAKAASARIFTGGASAMHVTIAGLQDTPIPEASDLHRNLLAALRTYGDPTLSIQLAMRELLLLVLSARLAPDPAYQWEDVVTRVRTALLHHFGFDRRKLGQPVVLSEVIALIQSQRGVLYVDVDALGAVSQLGEDGERRSPQEIGEALSAVINDASERGRPEDYVRVLGIRAGQGGTILPAQLAIFVPRLPETLILNRIDAA